MHRKFSIPLPQVRAHTLALLVLTPVASVKFRNKISDPSV